MATKKSKASTTKKSVTPYTRKRNVVPDSIDLRDQLYLPPVSIIPGAVLAPKADIPVLNQRDTSACTGFALASVVFHLQRSAKCRA